MLPIPQPLQVRFVDHLLNQAVSMTEFRKNCEALGRGTLQDENPKSASRPPVPLLRGFASRGDHGVRFGLIF